MSRYLYSMYGHLTGMQEWDIRDEKSIAECLRHSDTVINLVGRDYATKCVTERPFFRLGTRFDF